MKKLGQLIENLDPQVWKEHRDGLAFDAVFAKFSQNDALKMALLNTGSTRLGQASIPSQRVWGIGHTLKDRRALKPKYWTGQNLQGNILMKVRQKLREAAEVCV